MQISSRAIPVILFSSNYIEPLLQHPLQKFNDIHAFETSVAGFLFHNLLLLIFILLLVVGIEVRDGENWSLEGVCSTWFLLGHALVHSDVLDSGTDLVRDRALGSSDDFVVGGGLAIKFRAALRLVRNWRSAA